MIDGKLSDFIDSLYYGQEIVFLYQSKKYFIQGWWSDDKTTAILVLEKIDDKPFTGYIWKHQDESMIKCAEAFLAAPIWNGKNFLEIEKEVTWSDW